MERPLYAYTYVPRPFDEVAEILAEDPSRVLQPATVAAAGHAEDIRSRITVRFGHFEIGREIRITVGALEPYGVRTVALPLRWEAADADALFPSVTATLEVSAVALHPPLTQVTLVGSYRPPMGLLGAAGDALVGHRVAEAAVHRFLAEVARRADDAARPLTTTA